MDGMQCPYYEGEKRLSIICTSVIKQAQSAVTFTHKEYVDNYIRKYCDSENWKECLYARCLEAQKKG